jgi:dipeptidase
MHAAFGPVRGSQTTGSMVSYLQPDQPTHFVTGTAAPCTSLFKPIWHDIDVPDIGPEPSGTYDDATLFWRHEQLHRATLADYAQRMPLYEAERDALEARWVEEALTCARAPAAERYALSARCFAGANEKEQVWQERVMATNVQDRPGWLYNLAWQNFNKQAAMGL